MKNVRIRALAIVSVLSLVAPFAAQAENRPDALSRITINNFGQINDGYYRGAQPEGRDYADLAALGVKTVIDLTRNGDPNEPAAVKGQGMQFYRIPLTTTSQPPLEAVTQFLSLVNNPANLPVYVHCQGGRHRTGVMTAVYRLTHDAWTPDRAYTEMKQFEFEKGFISHGALKNFVYTFYQTLAGRPALSAVGGAR